MKTMLSIAIAALVLTLAAGCAHQTEAKSDHYSNMTGSYLPQDTKRNGPVSNGTSNVRVLDRNDIDSTGAADLDQTLKKSGVR